MSPGRDPARAGVGEVLAEQDPVELQRVAGSTLRGPAGRAAHRRARARACRRARQRRQQLERLRGDARGVSRELEPEQVLVARERDRAAVRARVGACVCSSPSAAGVHGDAATALAALLDERRALARRERHGRADRERGGVGADYPRVASRSSSSASRRRCPSALLDRERERIELARPAPGPPNRRQRLESPPAPRRRAAARTRAARRSRARARSRPS